MTVAIGVLGAGSRCRDHVETLDRMDDVDVTAIADVDVQRATELAEPRGATVYEDHRTLVTDEELDALVIGLPPFVHLDHEVLAAERGIGVFVEPPIALTLERAREIEAAIDRNGGIAQVGYQRRFADGLREAASILEDRSIGLLNGIVASDVPNVDWWRDREKSGGQVVEQATHVYDSIRFLAGDITEVTAYGGTRLVDALDFEDAVTASMRHENGAVSHVASTAAAHDRRAEIEILAEDAHLHVRGNGVTGRVDGEAIEYEGTNDPSVEQLESFMAAVRTGDDEAVAVPYGDGVRTLAVTLAVTESIRRDEPVAPTRLQPSDGRSAPPAFQH